MEIAYYQEEEKARLRERLSREAVELALQGRWEEAEALNKVIIEKFPTDVEAYNRLGRALAELGDFERAKEAYLKALELSPGNAIAKKNLARLTSLSSCLASGATGSKEIVRARPQSRKVDPEFFSTEMGKAGMVDLYNVAPSTVLARLGHGDRVYLKISGRHLMVEDGNGEYLGELEPKQALRLIKLMEGGNRYDAAILSIDGDKVKVVIKEVYQHPSQAGRPSFPVRAEKHLRSHIADSFLKHKILSEESEVFAEVEHEEEDLEQEEEYLPEGFSLVSEEEGKSPEL